MEELLHEHDGSVPVEVALEMLPTVSGTPLSRERVGLLANSIGARLVGPCIEWSSEPALSRRRGDVIQATIASLPELAAEDFCRFLAEAKPLEVLPLRLDEWLMQMREEARVNPAVEGAQVERLHAMARDVLRSAVNTTNEELRALASAAVEYLVAYDDGCADKSLGGLDDDEHVLEVVAGRLRRDGEQRATA